VHDPDAGVGRKAGNERAVMPGNRDVPDQATFAPAGGIQDASRRLVIPRSRANSTSA
jgi:hypothetical protein